jgi:hypothetical protein
MLALGGEGQQKLTGEESFRWPFFLHDRKPSIGAGSQVRFCSPSVTTA